jgi:TIR domain
MSAYRNVTSDSDRGSMNPGSVFISHSSRQPDFGMTERLAAKLKEAGIDVWWDSQKLEGGQQFTVEILEAIIRQHYFLFLISAHSVSSPWCRREVTRAVELGKLIIPLRLDDLSAEHTPLELAGLQWIDLRKGLDDALPALYRALGLGLAQPFEASDDPFSRDGRLVAALAEQLNYGKTFTDSLNLVQLLSNIGLRCCATERARDLFTGMVSLKHYRGSKIDYDKVTEYLLQRWQA